MGVSFAWLGLGQLLRLGLGLGLGQLLRWVRVRVRTWPAPPLRVRVRVRAWPARPLRVRVRVRVGLGLLLGTLHTLSCLVNLARLLA